MYDPHVIVDPANFNFSGLTGHSQVIKRGELQPDDNQTFETT
jgi:hypothetical protein